MCERKYVDLHKFLKMLREKNRTVEKTLHCKTIWCLHIFKTLLLDTEDIWSCFYFATYTFQVCLTNSTVDHFLSR